MPLTRVVVPLGDTSPAPVSMHPPIAGMSSLPRCCRRHRRNSDVSAECLLSRHGGLSDISTSGGGDGGGELVDESAGGSAECRTTAALHRYDHHDLVSDGESTAHQHASATCSEEHARNSHASARTADSLTIGRKSHHRRHYNHNHGLVRKHSAPAPKHNGSESGSNAACTTTANSAAASQNPNGAQNVKSAAFSCAGASGAAMHAAGASLDEAIKRNTQDEPMSSMKALRIFNTVFPAAHWRSPRGGLLVPPEHDPSCKQCVSEAMVTAHQAAAGGMLHGSHSELRMNLGDGRNAVYVAPCERHLECPLETKGKYLIHTNKPKIMTDMSKVEFGIRVDGWKRVVFKTVNDPALAKRELSFYKKTAASDSGHIMRLLDEFADNSNKHVMVFPRMSNASVHGHDLYGVAYIARQLFQALEDLHLLGIAHLDITPTNLMADPDDSSHIQVIDFGLACDVAECEDGLLPSRGTCGFVAPEILAGSARDLRADIYSAGVVLGMMLQRYLPTVNLRLLGGPLIRSDTTDLIIAQLDELLDAYKYVPEQAEFVECNTTYVRPKKFAPADTLASKVPALIAPVSISRVSSTEVSSVSSVVSAAELLPPTRRIAPTRADGHYRNSRNYSDEDDEAAAYAAAYAGGASMYSCYGNISDDDDDDGADASSYRSNGLASFYSRHNVSGFSAGRGRGNGDQQNHIGSRAETGHPRHSSYISGSGHPIHPSTSASATCLDDDSAGIGGGEYYMSPSNTPVFSRSLCDRPPGRTAGLSNLLGNTPDGHSSARYKPISASYPRNAVPRAMDIYSSPALQTSGAAAQKPGCMPTAVLHAADLLRWTLQASPRCRPTATQALSHPLLGSVEIRPLRRRAPSPMGVEQPSPSNVSQQSPTHGCSASPQRGEGACSICSTEQILPLPVPHTLHSCGSRTGVVSQCTSNAATPEPPVAQAAIAAPETATSASPAKDATDMFKGTALNDMGQWESEMHIRLGRLSSSGHGSNRLDGDGYLGSHHHNSFGGHRHLHSYSSVQDEVASFYSSTSGSYDDISCYFN